MTTPLARKNHYVPQWYQRGFLTEGQHKLHVLNLHPSQILARGGRPVIEPEIEIHGPKMVFFEEDLYTTRFGSSLNDEIERFLFGEIDSRGADAVRAWTAGDAYGIHTRFMDFFTYLDAQKLRTPKGLDWILKQYSGLPQNALMLQMQALRRMHATMWTECVREIVSAKASTVKFLLTDHPVAIYNAALPPAALENQYPADPGIELIGSQTLFALDANHCLILTNLEYAESPNDAPLLRRRTNARFRGNTLARTDACIRGRELAEAEVLAINRILKARARKYVAASNPDWLRPESDGERDWREPGPLLLPKKELWKFGGEIYIGHRDGSSSFRDKFGRTSSAHEVLTKKRKSEEPSDGDTCACGSGVAFEHCCRDMPVHERPSWDVLSIRERNIVLLRGIHDILGLEGDVTWLDIRRNFSDDQVRRINELFGTLWPLDTQLSELLPRPQNRRSRALYLGMTDAHSLQAGVLGVLPYFDELIVAHPFSHPDAVKPEYSAVRSPGRFRQQTLRNVFALLLLEPGIRSGRIHVVPDPLDYDVAFREEIKNIVESGDERVVLEPVDQSRASELAQSELRRAIGRLPPDRLKAYLARHCRDANIQLSEGQLVSLVAAWKEELERDPLVLLDPLPQGEDQSEVRMLKGFARETGLFIATMTGSIVYTDSDTQWKRLHESDGVHAYVQDSANGLWMDLVARCRILVPVDTFFHESEPPDAGTIRELLRKIVVARSDSSSLSIADATDDQVPESMRLLGMCASAPVGGFNRVDVSRLVITFGQGANMPPVGLALYFSAAQ